MDCVSPEHGARHGVPEVNCEVECGAKPESLVKLKAKRYRFIKSYINYATFYIIYLERNERWSASEQAGAGRSVGSSSMLCGRSPLQRSLTVFRARALGPTAKSLHTPAPGQGQGSQAVV